MESQILEPTTTIRLRNLTFHGPIGCDTWGRPAKTTQPVSCSVSVRIPLSRQDATGDDLDRSLDYSKLASLILSLAQEPVAGSETDEIRYASPVLFNECVCNGILRLYPHLASAITLSTTLPVNTLASSTKATWHRYIRAPALIEDKERGCARQNDILELSDIHAATVIGIRDHEKLEAQTVRIHVRVSLNRIASENPRFEPQGSLAHRIVREVVETVREARVGTVEALVAILWDMLLVKWVQPSLIEVLKPDAVAFVGGAGAAMEVEDGDDSRSWDRE